MSEFLDMAIVQLAKGGPRERFEYGPAGRPPRSTGHEDRDEWAKRVTDDAIALAAARERRLLEAQAIDADFDPDFHVDCPKCEHERRKSDALDAVRVDEVRDARTALAAMTAERDALKAEVEKWRGAASALCGAHIGLKFAGCPACNLDRLRAQTSGTASPVVALTDCEKAAEEIARTIENSDAGNFTNMMRSILRSHTRTLDREEIEQAIRDGDGRAHRAADAVLALLGQPEKAKECVHASIHYLNPAAAVEEVRFCTVCGARADDQPSPPPPAPVDEAEVERVAKAIRDALHEFDPDAYGARSVKGQDTACARAAIQALGQRDSLCEYEATEEAIKAAAWDCAGVSDTASGTREERAEIMEHNIREHFTPPSPALGQRESSVDVEALAQACMKYATTRNVLLPFVRDEFAEIIALYTRPGQRAKAGGETAFVVDRRKVIDAVFACEDINARDAENAADAAIVEIERQRAAAGLKVDP